MNIEALRDYCIGKTGVSESFPFDSDTLVFKVMGKMYALVNISKAESVNLKCDPDRALELRAQFPDDVFPGYHMSKKHWNTVMIEGRLTQKEIEELIDHSYELVALSLKKADRETLGF